MYREARRTTPMATVTVPVPDSITESEARLLLAVKLFETGRLSCGQAAEVAGHSKRAFTELLGRYQVPVFNYPGAEVASDVANA
jgi:predicted HTH domain antitoxin